ncbi:hypothetical protein chiPu_0025367, partial [Chiloscyllium punctatum]|nr:hypothetical protein [Chiloscyllium punctatum]
ELCLTAFDMYKTIGQNRLAQLLGKDLADFYMYVWNVLERAIPTRDVLGFLLWCL